MSASPWPAWSLRAKLIASCVLIQLAAATLLLLGSIGSLQHTLLAQATYQTQQVTAVLDQAIAAPLAQRDYATLQQTLDLVRNDQSINYLVLWDHRGKLVAASGWDTARPLPPRDAGDVDLERDDATLHLAAPIDLAGQRLGRLDLGLSTTGLRAARTAFVQRSLGIAAVALGLSALLMTLFAFAITRRLSRLAQASQRVAAGDFDVLVPVATGDEIGRLGKSFNTMAAALKQRVLALQDSERQQRRHLNTAREEHARLTTLLGAMRSGILFVDTAGRVIYANASFARLWSLPDLSSGQRLDEIVPLLVSQTAPADAVRLEAMLHPHATEAVTDRELHTLDGRIIAQRMQPVSDGDDGGGCIWFHQDITLERQTEQRAHQALHDPLTKLLNRRGLHDALHSAIRLAAMEQSAVTLMFIDLDDFKLVNDAGGHRAGDDTLVAVARALAGQLRSGEIVARLGGDEFAVLCPGIRAADAGIIAGRLVEAVSALRVSASAQTLRVGCSVGIATYPIDASNEEDLLACADSAMYQAKQNGKNDWALYRSHNSAPGALH